MPARRRTGLLEIAFAIGLIGAIAVAWFWKSNKDGGWDLDSVEPPWSGGIAIYEHISKHISADSRGLAEGGERLPDEKDDGKPKWVAGGLDGAFGHHGGTVSEQSRVEMVHRALGVVLADATPAKLKLLYDQLLQGSVIDYIDPLVERLVEKQDLDVDRLEQLAVWLAKNSPDREPVKFAITLLAVMIHDSDHSDLLMTLGTHEEFTLYAAIAFWNAGASGEGKLFELAQRVDGWGRIQVVERLAETSNPKIKAWMLREGYKNSVMYEYIAYTCASTGGLRGELEEESVDPALLAGAGDLIQALVIGGPAEDMDDYADGAVVVERYLHHLGEEPKHIEELIALDYVRRFLDQESDWKAREQLGWTPALRERLRTRVMKLRSLPHWKQTIAVGLASEDAVTFNNADQAAKTLGIDTWDHNFARLESGKGTGWYFVMQTDDPARIDRVIALAEKVLPLDEIATGPAEEWGMGPEWVNHGHLDFVLQDLRRFPGKGWPLIRAGVRSPVIRNRHMALRSLSPWGKQRWPSDAQALLEATLREEPNEDVRGEIETLLAGKEIEEPRLDYDEQ